MFKIKKVISMALAVAMVATMSTSVFAAEPNGNLYADTNTTQEQQDTRTADIPDTVWDLSSVYRGEFNFFSNVYSSYLFKTTTGKISMNISAYPDSSLTGTFSIKLYKKKTFGSDVVASTTLSFPVSNKSITFTGLDSNAKYYICLSKASVGPTLSGTYQVSN